jgi:hypothetical protein
MWAQLMATPGRLTNLVDAIAVADRALAWRPEATTDSAWTSLVLSAITCADASLAGATTSGSTRRATSSRSAATPRDKAKRPALFRFLRSSAVAVSSPLTGARAKVARANEHLAELDTLGSRWAARISYTLHLEVLNTNVLVAKMFDLANAEPPLQMALVAGDAVHNLRSALDHVIYQFAVAGGASGERSEYPIFEDAGGYERQMGQRLEGIAEDLCERIKATQPFHLRDGDEWRKPSGPIDPLAINAALRLIRRLDNRDKHRLALRGSGRAPARAPTFRGVRTAEGTFAARSITLQDGEELFRVQSLEPLAGAPLIQVGFRPVFSAVFGEEKTRPREAEPVRASVADLHEAARLVSAHVESFADPTDVAAPPGGADDLSPAPNSVIDWKRPGGETAKVGVSVDLGIWRRRILDVWPEVITAIEGARSVGDIWARLDEAGVEAQFAVKSMDTPTAIPEIDVAVELEDRSGEKDVWFAAIQPMPAGTRVPPDPARNTIRPNKKRQRRTKKR